MHYEECCIPGMHFSYGTAKGRGESLYRNLRGKLEAKMSNYRHSFSNPKLIYQTALSKYFWGLMDQRLSPQIKWKIIRHSSTLIASTVDVTYA